MSDDGEFWWGEVFCVKEIVASTWNHRGRYWVHLHFFLVLLPFRMSLEDFCRNFRELNVCRNVYNPILGQKELESVVGCWTVNDDPLMNRSGGCYNNQDTFLQNPQVWVISFCLQVVKAIGTQAHLGVFVWHQFFHLQLLCNIRQTRYLAIGSHACKACQTVSLGRDIS